MATSRDTGRTPAADAAPDDRAASATLHSFLNCYLHEIGGHEVVDAAETPLETDCGQGFRLSLPEQSIEVFVPLSYYSAGDRHLFGGPGVSVLPDGRVLGLDYLRLARLLLEELSLARDAPGAVDELLLRVVESCRNTARAVEARRGDEERLYGFDTTFRNA
ncbi:IucA/IucC family siderophore biosynthesis protein, partial [Haloferax sp. AB510]|nr:IucA/IucC family siderophore biosynthesis protein [Haloferax sp. AB510]